MTRGGPVGADRLIEPVALIIRHHTKTWLREIAPFKSRKILDGRSPFWRFESTSFWRSLLFIIYNGIKWSSKKKNYMVLWRIQWGIFFKKVQIDWIKIEHTVSKTKKYFFFWPTRYIFFQRKLLLKLCWKQTIQQNPTTDKQPHALIFNGYFTVHSPSRCQKYLRTTFRRIVVSSLRLILFQS